MNECYLSNKRYFIHMKKFKITDSFSIQSSAEFNQLFQSWRKDVNKHQRDEMLLQNNNA